jgi:hypothetical protein
MIFIAEIQIITQPFLVMVVFILGYFAGAHELTILL